MMHSYEVGIFIAMILFYLVFGAIGLADYIFKSIGLHRIAGRLGEQNPWLAWIPFARTYLHGKIAGSLDLGNRKVKNLGIWLLVVPLVGGALFWIGYIILIVAMVGTMGSWAFQSSMHGSFGAPTGFFTTLIVFYILFVIGFVVYFTIYEVIKVFVNKQILERFTTSNMAIFHAVVIL